ncbi:uncharacterized protein LOC141598818 [Silene latifolia]|uniref:uncharacterized protein LOC141598818 n=1 Tax=Silene latifolia TaxID=37657 RepID=UPI003D76D2A8
MSMATTSSPAIFTHFNLPKRHNQLPSSPLTLTPSNYNPNLIPRLQISHNAPVFLKQRSWVPVQFCCSTGISPETSDDSSQESSINIKLPRRSMLVQFTCNVCGERTKRMVNRLAYERGTVFVQCSGCLQHHKLVDNLGLVVEYDFRNEANED